MHERPEVDWQKEHIEVVSGQAMACPDTPLAWDIEIAPAGDPLYALQWPVAAPKPQPKEDIKERRRATYEPH